MTAGSGTARLIGVDALVQCPGCAATIPLAGPVLHARCHRCGKELAISQGLWVQTLGEVDERSFEAGTTFTASGVCRREHAGIHLTVEWTRQEPACRNCTTVLRLVEPGSSGETRCSSCDMPMPTFPAPPWARAEIPTALQVYGVEYVFDAAALDAPARRWWIEFQGTPPRRAAAQQMFIEHEVVVMSQRLPQKPESRAYLIPLVLVVAMLLFATWYMATSVRDADDEFLELSE